MNESFMLVLVVGGLIAALFLARRTSADRDVRALARIEAKLDALLTHERVQFDPFSEVPSSVAAAIQRGKKIEAIKEYRLATGVGLKEAKEYVEQIERRQSPPHLSQPR